MVMDRLRNYSTEWCITADPWMSRGAGGGPGTSPVAYYSPLPWHKNKININIYIFKDGYDRDFVVFIYFIIRPLLEKTIRNWRVKKSLQVQSVYGFLFVATCYCWTRSGGRTVPGLPSPPPWCPSWAATPGSWARQVAGRAGQTRDVVRAAGGHHSVVQSEQDNINKIPSSATTSKKTIMHSEKNFTIQNSIYNARETWASFSI